MQTHRLPTGSTTRTSHDHGNETFFQFQMMIFLNLLFISEGFSNDLKASKTQKTLLETRLLDEIFILEMLKMQMA